MMKILLYKMGLIEIPSEVKKAIFFVKHTVEKQSFDEYASMFIKHRDNGFVKYCYYL